MLNQSKRQSTDIKVTGDNSKCLANLGRIEDDLAHMEN